MTSVDHQRIEAQARAAQDDDFFGVLLPEAAELVITAGHASPSMLGRKMRVGDTMACDLLAELEDLEVVSPANPDRSRQVLVAPDSLDEVLARIADLAAGEDAETPDDPPPAPVVSLVKDTSPDTSDEDEDWCDEDDQPSGELVLRPDDDLVLYEGEHQVPERQHLVTRTIQATRRGRHWATHQPTLVRTASITVQTPKAAGLLVKNTPRGIGRSAQWAYRWWNDSTSANLLVKHADAGEGDQYAKVAAARQQANLAGKRTLVGVVVALAGVIAAAWWAPTIFSGVLAVLVGGGLAALVPRRDLKEFLAGLAFAAIAAVVAWFQGPNLAALVPQPPTWIWWVAGGVLVVVFGLVGRKDDQKLMDMPINTAPEKPPAVTAPMVVEALFRLGVTGMTTLAADKGMRDEIRVIAPGVASSKHGYTIEMELPPGVTAEMIVAKRGPLAAALRRDLGCVWPSGNEDRHPGYLRIFISHKPMNRAQQPPWPLAAGLPVDIFDPLPQFTDEEMRWVNLTLAATPHLAVGGASGFGKSVWLRQLSCAVAFDPRVQIVVIDGKRSGDLDHVRKLAHTFLEGADEEDMAAVIAELRRLVQEYLKRSKFLSKLPPEDRSPKVTSELASKYPLQLSPIVVFYDEVQEGTQYGVKTSREDKAIRDEITGLLTRLSRVGRSAGIYLVLASQRPEADVIPSSIMGNCSIRVAFKVSDQIHNDQILGTSARKNGIDATMFGSRDKGMAWLKGGDDVDAQVVRSWSEMVDVSLAEELADKAYALRKSRGLLTGQAADDGIADAEVVYDIREDAEQVMRQRGAGKAQWGELAEWLRNFRPGQYGDLTEAEVSASIRTTVGKPRDVRSGNSVKKGVYLSDLRKQRSDDVDE